MKRRLFHFGRLNNCDPRILAFFEWWADEGPFPLTIPPGGGLRTDSAHQEGLFLAGYSRARTLDLTPHGRGAAADAYPAILDPSGSFVESIFLAAETTEGRKLFVQYGELAEARGLKWGGRFKPLSQSTGLGWDLPHLELPRWQDLPYPPPNAEGATR